MPSQLSPSGRLASFALLLFTPLISAAHGFSVGDLRIEHPYATATVAGQSVGGVYFKHIENTGAAPDSLIAASVSKDIAQRTEIHTMNTENDVMRMRQIKAIVLPANSSTPMSRGLHKNGYHIMLMNLAAPLKVGDKLPLKLTFEKAGTLEVVVHVEALKPNAPMQGHQH